MSEEQGAEQSESAAPAEISDAEELFVFRPSITVHGPPSAQPSSGHSAGPSQPPRPAYPSDPTGHPGPQDPLLEQDIAYFQQMLTQYWTFPTNESDSADCVHFNLQALSIIYSLIARSERCVLTYGDLHQLETALLCVMPETVLRCEAGMRRARYHAVAPPTLLHAFRRSKLSPLDDASAPVEVLRAEMAMLLRETQRHRTHGDRRADSRATACQVSACWAVGVCTMGMAGSVLSRLAHLPPEIAPVVSLLMGLLGGGGAAFAYARLTHS